MSESVAESVIAKIRHRAAPDVGEITNDTELDSLGIHSLELTEIIFDVEDEFAIEIDMNTSDAWENLTTVGDIVLHVQQLVDKKNA